MEAYGVIGRYAIGGALAAIFYVEPFATYDLDIFFLLARQTDDLLPLEPIYEYLSRAGYRPEGEAVEIEGWPVRFLPVFNPLLEEAVAEAQEIEFNGTPTRVMRAEHLIAIMLQTGRAKDYARAAQFLEEGVVDQKLLAAVLTRHDLAGRWEEFRQRFS